MIRALACVAWLVVMTGLAHAGVVQAPEGGKAVPAIERGVVCGPLSGGWTIDPTDRRRVVPPPATEQNIARTLEAKIADTQAACATSQQTVTLVALGAAPELDSAGITLWPDDGRLELRGARLKGVQIMWSVPGDDKKHGSDACLDAQAAQGAPGKPQTCTIALAPGLPADVQLSWAPAYARLGADVATFDAYGNRVEAEALRIKPARVVLSKPLVQATGIDVSALPARIVLTHPEAVTSVDCGGASCELVDRAVSVRAVPDPQAAVSLKLRLAPRVFASRGEALDAVVTTEVALLACPMTVIAGTVVRDVDDPGAVVRLDPGCARDPNRLRWSGGSGPAEVKQVVKASDGVYVWLHLERVTAEHVTIVASRPDLENTTVALATQKTVALPQSAVTLELPGHGKIDFVPTNRPASVAVAGGSQYGRLVPISVEGTYTVSTEAGVTTIRGEPSAEGFVSLLLAYRVPTLPAELATADLAVTHERVQRAMREAAVPAPIGASAYVAGDHALVEVMCGESRLEPGHPYRIAWQDRASCRVVLHAERLSVADGGQEVTVDVEVTKPDGTPRSDAKLSEHMVLRAGAQSRVIAIKSTLDEFDHVDVRVSHVIDESRYVVSSATPSKPGVLAAQWTAIVAGSKFRLYATATIPAGLYRVNQPAGQLTLNFGVLSRLVALDHQGKERLLGLELGVMGVGLAPQSGNVQFPRTLAIVAGLGLRVPLGQGATIGIDGWAAYELRDGPIYRDNGDGTRSEIKAGAWSFIFGPSISFGNVGRNL